MQGITDEQIERVKAALASATDNINEGRTESSLPHPELILWPSEYEYLAEVAIAAVLGDVEREPMEDVLGHLKLMEIWKVDDEWRAMVHPTGNPRAYSYGVGPTIDAAIRNAVEKTHKGVTK